MPPPGTRSWLGPCSRSLANLWQDNDDEEEQQEEVIAEQMPDDG
jgi:hypothetical protein